jgi:ATP-dependent protease ClpP protease subunit
MDTERDFFMSGEEAVQYGLVDDVITSRNFDKKIEVVGGKKKVTK